MAERINPDSFIRCDLVYEQVRFVVFTLSEDLRCLLHIAGFKR